VTRQGEKVPSFDENENRFDRGDGDRFSTRPCIFPERPLKAAALDPAFDHEGDGTK
jgi:hypothetical protein